MARETKKETFEKFFRIVQNTYSKKYKVERNYPQEIADGKFKDEWLEVRGAYGKLSDAQAAKQEEIETLKADCAQWVVV